MDQARRTYPEQLGRSAVVSVQSLWSPSGELTRELRRPEELHHDQGKSRLRKPSYPSKAPTKTRLRRTHCRTQLCSTWPMKSSRLLMCTYGIGMSAVAFHEKS